VTTSTKDNNWGCSIILLAILSLVLIPFLLPTLTATWPGWLFLVCGVAACLWLRKRNDPFSVASREILQPATVGLAVLFAFALALNSLHLIVEIGALHELEWTLVTWRLALSEVVEPSYWIFVAVMALLILGAAIAPRTRLVKRYLKLQRWLLRLYAGLVAVTSFTFFVDRPLDRFLDLAHEELTRQIESSEDTYGLHLRQEEDAVARCLAATALRRATEAGTVNVTGLIVLFQELDREISQTRYSYGMTLQELEQARNEIRHDVLSAMAREHVRASLEQPAAHQAVEALRPNLLPLQHRSTWQAAETPRSRGEWRREIAALRSRQHQVEAEQLRVRAAEMRAQEALAGFQAVFSEAMGRGLVFLGLPEFVETYGQALVGSFAESVFQEHVRKSYSEGVPNVDVDSVLSRLAVAVPALALAVRLRAPTFIETDFAGRRQRWQETIQSKVRDIARQRITRTSEGFKRIKGRAGRP
jgi:hypothetical protein